MTALERHRRIADLEARLAAATHDAVVARDRADLAVGILRKLKAEAGVEMHTMGATWGGCPFLGLDCSTVVLTDAEAALFDSMGGPE